MTTIKVGDRYKFANADWYVVIGIDIEKDQYSFKNERDGWVSTWRKHDMDSWAKYRVDPDVVTVQQVEAQWDIGEAVKKPISLQEYAERRGLANVDVVNHPSHYKFENGVEVIDLTEQLSFCAGNVVKYVARAGRKDATKRLEDLRKAEFYLKREIKRVETAGEDL